MEILVGSLLALAGWLNPPTQSGALTLKDAIGIAVRNSYSVHRAESAIAKTRGQVNEGYAHMRPTVTATGTYTRFDQATTASFPGQDSQGNPVTQTIAIQPNATRTANVTLIQPIDLAGLQRIGVRAAKSVEAASRKGLAAATDIVVEGTKLAYFDVLRAQSAVGIAETALKNAQERKRLAEAQVSAGTASKIDVLRADTQVAQDSQLLTAAKNAVQLATAGFNNVLARDVNTPVELAPVFDLPAVGQPLDKLTEAALGHRPEVGQLADIVKANEENVRLQQRGNWPSLNLSAVNNFNFDTTLFNSRKSTLTGVAVLSVPLWTGGVTKARVEQASADLDTAKINLAETKQGVTLEVKQALIQVQDASERLHTAETAVTEAQEALRLSQLRYQNGIAIQLEVSDAELAYTQAQINVINARYDYLQAYSRLQKAVGMEEL